MKDAEKNRDPERARKRAKADARCALRKLGLWDELERLAGEESPTEFCVRRWTSEVAAWATELMDALDLEVK